MLEKSIINLSRSYALSRSYVIDSIRMFRMLKLELNRQNINIS